MQQLQNAFVLHVRPYSDSRVLVEWLTYDAGRIACIARLPGKRNRSEFQLFQGHLIDFKGKGELKTLTQVESIPAERYALSGEAIKCGFYINELLIRVLPKEECEKAIFEAYQNCLGELMCSQNNQIALRNFELDCIAELGYGVDFQREALDGQSLVPERYYELKIEQGFVAVECSPSESKGLFLGASLIAIGQRRFETTDVLRAAKQLCRMLLAPLLGDKPLKSRELFR